MSDVEEAVVLVKRRRDVWADYTIATFTYKGEDEFIRKRERIKELLSRAKFDEKEA